MKTSYQNDVMLELTQLPVKMVPSPRRAQVALSFQFGIGISSEERGTKLISMYEQFWTIPLMQKPHTMVLLSQSQVYQELFCLLFLSEKGHAESGGAKGREKTKSYILMLTESSNLV